MKFSNYAFGRNSTADDVTQGIDLEGRVALVTGSNSGLGLESVRVLARRGAHIFAAARSLQKAEEVASQIDGQVTPVECELSDLYSASRCVERVKELTPKLDILMCNAGIMALPSLQLRHGVEMQFCTNHLGHFLLVSRLLDLVYASDQGRVVMLSSGGHTHTVEGGIDFDNLDGSSGYDAWKFYGQSKLANVLMSKELSRRMEGTSATCNAVHPGVIRTNLSRNMTGLFSGLISFFAKPFERSIEQGAATQCFVATHPDLHSTSGEYFSNCRPAKPSKYAQDLDLAAELWSISEKNVASELGEIE